MKLMILDGNSIVNRAFYGIRMLNAPDGTPTNGVYGFLSILRKLLDDQKPEAVCVAFDLKAPTFRHMRYEGYKAQRKAMPEELAVQMPILKQVLDAMGVLRLELESFEADDLLGTVAAKCRDSGWECRIVTGDKDSFQLISDTTHVCHVKSRMGQTTTTEYTPELFFDEYGFEPRSIIDLKALMGDASDNIPGVPGVGEKTAMALVQRYKHLETIYADINTLDVKEGVRKKLREGRESAFLSFELATIHTDAPIEFSPEDAVWQDNYRPELYDIFKKLGFNKFIEKWGLSESAESAEAAKTEHMPYIEDASSDDIMSAVNAAGTVAVTADYSFDSLEICDGKAVYLARWNALGDDYTRLTEYIFSDKVKKIGHNVKNLMTQLIAEKLPIDGFEYDTALACYLLDATASDYGLSRMSIGYCGTELAGAEAVYRLRESTEKKLKQLGMTKLFYDIEMPLCRVLADMQEYGFMIDRAALSSFGESLTGTILELEREIYAQSGCEFNINSPKQLGEVLFDKLMLPAGKKTKTGWSTNADVLEKLRGKHPIVQMVLDYRMLTKLKSTYADGLLKLIDPDGRIRTKFQMTVTATGRLSSTDPNLQNIPIRRELGSHIREMFIASKGNVLVDADYSQIELRLLAHISGDKHMQEAFLSGEDIHTVTASQVFNTPIDEVTPLQRSRAKAVNFGIVYGISAWSLAQDIGVMQSEAKAYMEAYLNKYDGVREYMKAIVEKAKHDGYVQTLYARRRYLPELKSSNFNTRSFGERVALNMPIQGTAADIIKLAMVNVYNRFKAEGLKAKLILQVHDELICECPEGETQRVSDILREEMSGAAKLSVPLTVDVKTGHSWAEAH